MSDGLNSGNSGGTSRSRAAGRRARSGQDRGRVGRQPAAPESLERRSMLSATVLDVAPVNWQGKVVDAVRDQWVFRMPQATAGATARPAVPASWSVADLGSRFYTLTAPGASVAEVQAWAGRSGVRAIEPNQVSGRSALGPAPLADARPAALTSRSTGTIDPRAADQWGLAKISAPAGWQTTRGGGSVVVAVLDDGIDYTHADLQANMWNRPTNVPASVVGQYGYDFLANDDNPFPDGGAIHGTAVAGVIGAVGNNGIGVSGVAQYVRLLAARVGSSAGIVTSATIAAMTRLVELKTVYGVNIVAANAGYARNGAESAVESEAIAALDGAGISFVAAAGNDRIDITGLTGGPAGGVWPAQYNVQNVITVGASTVSDQMASYSNFSQADVDLAAPGGDGGAPDRGDILTTVPGNGYAYLSGTSMSAAMVSGAVALMKVAAPTATPVAIRTAMLAGADRVGSLQARVAENRRLNLRGALDQILQAAPPTTLPVPSFATTTASVLEGNAGFSFVDLAVKLDRAPGVGKSASVWYETAPGTALQGSDYQPVSGYVTFNGTETQKTIRVRVVGDRAIEPDESFNVRLVGARSRGVDPATTVTQAVTIVDDDGTTTPTPPPGGGSGTLPSVSVALKTQADPANPGQTVPMPIMEGGTATFVVKLDRAATQPVTVRYRTTQPTNVPAGTATAGSDYTAVAGTLTFRPGELQKEVVVRILADRVNDPNETFHFVLESPVNAQLGGGAGGGGGGGGAGGGTGATGGSSVTATITDVPYSPPAQPGFQIMVQFPDSSLTTSQQAVFQQAAARWQEIIVGDLPNVVDPATGQAIDDILIVARALDIDGPGETLGQAGPTQLRAGQRGLPWKGEMEFDTADLADLQADGELQKVIVHEMGHVLGFGSLWATFGLLTGTGGGTGGTGTTTNPLYVGANALREYRTLFGLPRATGVPVENSGGDGTALSHWREATMVTELMTGYLDDGVANPISRITVAAFQDLGYQVNYARADAYAKPTSAAMAAAAARVRQLAGTNTGGGGGGMAPAIRRAPLPALVSSRAPAATPAVAPAATVAPGGFVGTTAVRKAFAALAERLPVTGRVTVGPVVGGSDPGDRA